MQWTTKGLAGLIGTNILVPVGDMYMEAEVVDAAQKYGRLRVKVKPANGHGETWVENWKSPTDEEPISVKTKETNRDEH